MYVLLIAIIYLAFISLGLPDSLLGAAWPTLHVAFGVPISYMGIISIIISAGTVISSLLSERLTARFEKTKLLIPILCLISLILCTAYMVDSTFSPFAYTQF